MDLTDIRLANWAAFLLFSNPFLKAFPMKIMTTRQSRNFLIGLEFLGANNTIILMKSLLSVSFLKTP